MAENLWALREQKKISVAVLANRAGLPIGLIMEYESGVRSIEPRHLGRLAKALFVEESSIRLQSDPRPGTGPLERQPVRDVGRPLPPRPPAPTMTGRPREMRAPRPRPEPRPPAPARPSQVTHLDNLLKRLEKTRGELEAELGKPVAELDRMAISAVLKDLQGKVKDAPTPTRRRAYLPESVDEFEARYLAEAQAGGARYRFGLFNGSTVEGQIIGFGPYSITARAADGAEITMYKLALVCYARLPGGGQEALA